MSEKFVKVEWIDSTVYEGWRYPSETFSVKRNISYGILLEDAIAHITLITGRSEAGLVDTPLVIPRSAIVDFKIIHEEKPKLAQKHEQIGVEVN